MTTGSSELSPNSSKMPISIVEMGIWLATPKLVEVTRAAPLESLVWAFRKDPYNERQKMRYRTEETVSARSRMKRQDDLGGLHRSAFAYRAKQPDAWLSKLKSAVRRVSNQYPEMGYPKIARLLKQEDWSVGARIVQRLRRELGLAVPAKKPKRRRRGPSTGIPTQATHRNHVWTWDLVHDTTMRGGTLRMLTILDEYTRECLCIHVDRRINARKVRRITSAATTTRSSSSEDYATALPRIGSRRFT